MILYYMVEIDAGTDVNCYNAIYQQIFETTGKNLFVN